MKTQLHQLKNGLKIILIDTQAFPSATTLLLVGAGSRYENKTNNGIAHFFEHMAFKGSKKYPSALKISTIIDNLGGVFNAFTSKDYTGYFIKAPTQHFDSALDVIADMIQNPLLKTEEINKEKGVIAEEINMYEDYPGRIIVDHYEELLYDGHPLGMEITGTKQTVNKFTKKTFIDYINSLYHPNNAILIVAGGLNHKTNLQPEKYYLDLITKKFSRWQKNRTGGFKKIKENQKQKAIFVKTKKTDQIHFCFGYRTFSYFDRRRYALTLLSAVLGKGMSSRLFTEVREKRGLCYYIYTYNSGYADCGSMVTHAGVRANVNDLNKALSLIKVEHEKIADGKITEKELKKAKELIKGNFVLSLEDTFDVAAFYGKNLLLENRLEQPAEIMKKLDKVTVEQVVAVAKQVIKDRNLNIALIGNIKKSDVRI